ncbi:MAG: 3-oxoadipate enol-lactonase 2 [Bacteroidota bacterium]|nr:MAG: 3-oxoadipate enol-lactonase 2 [Bacteroidota bacterium]
MLHYSTYEHTTSKEWVTFVHGAGGSSSIWYKQIRAYTKHYNVLMLDLRGHGNSKPKLKQAFKERYTFDVIVADIIEVLDHEKIAKTHFIGISLGTIIIRQLAENNPERVSSMIMGGAIMKLNIRSQILMRFGNVVKSVIPYLWLYRFFAFIIMPKKNHRESRLLFVREAKKLYHKEFLRWYKLTSELKPLLRFFRQVDVNIPTLYVMGAEDYMFLPSVQKIVDIQQSASIAVVPDCGHVVNVEQPEVFNSQTLSFLHQLNA